MELIPLHLSMDRRRQTLGEGHVTTLHFHYDIHIHQTLFSRPSQALAHKDLFHLSAPSILTDIAHLPLLHKSQHLSKDHISYPIPERSSHGRHHH